MPCSSQGSRSCAKKFLTDKENVTLFCQEVPICILKAFEASKWKTASFCQALNEISFLTSRFEQWTVSIHPENRSFVTNIQIRIKHFYRLWPVNFCHPGSSYRANGRTWWWGRLGERGRSILGSVPWSQSSPHYQSKVDPGHLREECFETVYGNM